MALNKKDIEHLLRERGWYLERLQQVKAGAYGVEARHGGEVVDDRHETERRFADIIKSIEEVLTIAGVEFDA